MKFSIIGQPAIPSISDSWHVDRNRVDILTDRPVDWSLNWLGTVAKKVCGSVSQPRGSHRRKKDRPPGLFGCEVVGEFVLMLECAISLGVMTIIPISPTLNKASICCDLRSLPLLYFLFRRVDPVVMNIMDVKYVINLLYILLSHSCCAI